MADKSLVQFTHEDVSLKAVKSLYNGFFKVDMYEFEHSLFNGGKSQLIQREILERGDAIAVLPYDAKTQSVLLIEQIRIGAINSKHSPWLLECIAGMTDGSSDYEGVVKKKLLKRLALSLANLNLCFRTFQAQGVQQSAYIYI
ncbi:hypothetical protein ACOBV8_11470 [Pseudoalteromonas espejiana]